MKTTSPVPGLLAIAAVATPLAAAGAGSASAALDTRQIEQLTGGKGELDAKERIGPARDLARGLRAALDRTATRVGAR